MQRARCLRSLTHQWLAMNLYDLVSRKVLRLFAGQACIFSVRLQVVIAAKLDLADNVNVERSITKMPRADYAEYFEKNIRGNADIVFHNGDFYPPDYDTITAVTYSKTDKPATVPAGGSHA